MPSDWSFVLRWKWLLRGIDRQDREAGQVLILFAAGLIAFFGLVGMSVDVGLLVQTRTDLQKVADAAALAGAQDLPGLVGPARSMAAHYADLNANGVTAEITFTGDHTIHVTASKHIDFTFLRMIGIDGATPSAQASVYGKQAVVTGYHLHSTAPFVIWGGSRETEVNPGDQNCPLHTCVGKSYTFLSEEWMKNSGMPRSPDWSADSNNFKGAITHGDENEVIHIGGGMSVSSPGGLGSVTLPAVGSTVVIPIVSKATGNSDMRNFTIGAWAVVKVDGGCTKQKCTGTIQAPADAPLGAVTGGSVMPPDSLQQTKTEPELVE